MAATRVRVSLTSPTGSHGRIPSPAHGNRPTSVDDRLYRELDKVGAYNDRQCEHLMKKDERSFKLNFDFLLYDVTSTYSEVQAEGNEKAAPGYSRDHRGDCKQVCVGLACTPEGLPLKFEVFAGNRTTCTETDPAKLWRWYLQLTQAEATFRTAKSDIGLRPVFHQKSERVDAHLLVCFLSLALWRTLEMWMRGKGLGTSARKRVEAVGTIRSMDASVPVKRGDREVTLSLRTVAKPDPDVGMLLAHLGLKLPGGSRLVENVVEKTGR